MAEEELPLSGHGLLDVLLALNVLLTPVHHPNVPPAKGEHLVLQDVSSIGALVHQVQFGQHSDGADACSRGVT